MTYGGVMHSVFRLSLARAALILPSSHQEQESRGPASHPGGTMASLPHDSWTFPFRQQKEQNSMYLERWMQCGHPSRGRRGSRMCPVPACPRPACPSHGAAGARWGGRQGTGTAPRPGLRALSLVFCSNEAAGQNVARNLQPSAKPCQSPFPRSFTNQCARPPLPPRTVGHIAGASETPPFPVAEPSSPGDAETLPPKHIKGAPVPLTQRCI